MRQEKLTRAELGEVAVEIKGFDMVEARKLIPASFARSVTISETYATITVKPCTVYIYIYIYRVIQNKGN